MNAEKQLDSFEAIYNSDLCAIVFSDGDGYVTDINDYGVGVIGYPADEIIGHRIVDYTPEEDRFMLNRTVRDLTEGKTEKANITHRFTQKQGTTKWVAGSLSCYVDKDDDLMMQSIFVDITPEKQAAEKRDALAEIMSGVAKKYDSVTFCDIEHDEYRQIVAGKGRQNQMDIEATGKLAEALRGFNERCVNPEFQDIFLKFTSADYIRKRLTGDADWFEFQYQLNEANKMLWKLGEVVVASRDDKGEVARFCLLVTDITELKGREFERLRKSEAQAAFINIALANSNLYDFSYSPQDQTAVCSERTQRLFGCAEHYTNMPDSFRNEFVHPDHYQAFDELFAKCAAGEDGVSAEFKDPTGAHWHRANLHIVERGEAGATVLAVGVVEDIDEIQRARSTMERMNELCRSAVSSHYEGMILIDSIDGTYSAIDIGADFNDRWGHSDSKLVYDDAIRNVIENITESDEDGQAVSELYLESLVSHIKKNGKVDVRYRAKTPEGIRWKLVECSPLESNPSQIIVLVSDIQKEETAKEQLEAAMESADEANRAKSAFLANMSHEIRTPMNTIIGISEILMNKQLPVETLNEISTIQNAASGLLAIINDILDFSKIESGKFEITPVDYMMPSLLMDINNMISVRLVDRPVRWSIVAEHTLPNHLIGDDIRIEQILMNLLGNSVKFTKEGFIELRVHGERVDETSWKLVFQVSDSGIGIKDEDIEKLFGTFTQVDTTKNRAVTGSGLGLAISKSFAEMMGGDIIVDSTYGKGTTFTVEIMQQVKLYEPVGTIQKKDVKVLICENDELVISIVSRTLEDLGVEFRVCRETDKIRSYRNMTHVIVRRKRFPEMKEKLDFMFDPKNIYLLLENGEQAAGDYMAYKQLQLPLLCLQVINAINGETIANSYKRKNFDRSQIVPLTYAQVLIVDDNLTNLQVARGLMAPYKMKIDIATSGFKAIEMVKGVKYDLIFMDHMMPEMDGLETTQHIRELDGAYYKEVPIVALTANAVSNARDMFLANGLDDFLAKPIEMTELHRILKQYVQSKAPAGYMEEYLKYVTQSDKDKKKSASPMPGAPLKAGMQAFKPIVLPADSSAMGQLLSQNNALLSQNMLLLQGLLGVSADQGTGNTPQAAGALDANISSSWTSAAQPLPKAENDGFGLGDESDETLPATIPEVNSAKAVEALGGSVKVYHSILKTYYRDISEREPQLQHFFDSQDVENLTISVHAIKSASREIGADALGEMAAHLEREGKAADWAAVEEHFGPFMQELASMRQNVESYVQAYVADDLVEQAKTPARQFSADAVEKLKLACEDMDYETVGDLLAELDECSYPSAVQDTLNMMLGCCADFEYDKLEQMIHTL